MKHSRGDAGALVWPANAVAFLILRLRSGRRLGGASFSRSKLSSIGFAGVGLPVEPERAILNFRDRAPNPL
ncbi:MAG: hypothetical protein F9K25_15195 [Candidatus Contendobacter sp.]|nr:MAG: hypothetical protein F9K25_15195 [Candidatus Contendobacter sp.]